MHNLVHVILGAIIAAALILAPNGAVALLEGSERQSSTAPRICPVLKQPVRIYPLNRELIYFDPNIYLDGYMGWNEVRYATGYRLEVTKPNTDVIVVETNSFPMASFPDNDLYEHHWRIRALREGCPDGPWSDVWSYDLQWFAAPAIPINVTATDGAYAGKVHITWDDGPFNGWHPDSYLVYRSEVDNDRYIWINNTDWLLKSYDDTTAIPGKQYYYYISACNFVKTCSSLSYPSEPGHAGLLRHP